MHKHAILGIPYIPASWTVLLPAGLEAETRLSRMVLRFEASYPDGLCPGWSVRVRGETGSRTNEFQINFLCGAGQQIAFHFNPRFKDSVIVCNSFLDNQWGQEVLTDTFPLEANQPFQIEISSDQDYFHVSVDDSKVLQYGHRQKQLSDVSKVQILNDIHISSVEFARQGLY